VSTCQHQKRDGAPCDRQTVEGSVYCERHQAYAVALAELRRLMRRSDSEGVRLRSAEVILEHVRER